MRRHVIIIHNVVAHNIKQRQQDNQGLSLGELLRPVATSDVSLIARVHMDYFRNLFIHLLAISMTKEQLNSSGTVSVIQSAD